MKKLSFADAEYVAKKKTTRRDKFLGEMEQVVPWQILLDLLRPHYHQESTGRRGRSPVGLERMLRMYFVQQWYNLADEVLEDAVNDSQALRGFIGIDLGRESVPDATTVLNFRRLLEDQELAAKILETVNAQLRDRGLLLGQGTVVDATIIQAPNSTKNRAKARDPEMHQTKRGNQWHFGMKTHIGVDAHTGLVHTVVGTAANVSDVSQTVELLRGDEKFVLADAGYIGADRRPELKGKPVAWYIAEKRGQVKQMAEGTAKDRVKTIERLKAQLRSKVEHPFHVIKDLFGHRKVRYRGLKKNTAQLVVLFALGNFVLAKDALLA